MKRSVDVSRFGM